MEVFDLQSSGHGLLVQLLAGPVYGYVAIAYLLGRFETFLGLKRPGQFKTWFQNGQINNLAILKPHMISLIFQ